MKGPASAVAKGEKLKGGTKSPRPVVPDCGVDPGSAAPSGMTTLRSVIPLSDETHVPAGQPPHLGWVEIARLRIDDSYQRPLANRNINAIRRMAARFDWMAFSVIDVVPLGDGLFSVIDGQHRAHAALLCGIEKVPVRIIKARPGDAARAFAAINGDVVAVSHFDLYKAALAAGEEWAVNARDAVEAAGCRLMTGNRTVTDKKPGEVYAIQFVRSIVEAGLVASEALTLALTALRQSADGAVKAELWASWPLSAWVASVAGLDDWLDNPLAGDALVAFLDRFDLAAEMAVIDADIRAARAEGRGSGTKRTLLQGAIQNQMDALWPDKVAFLRMGEQGQVSAPPLSAKALAGVRKGGTDLSSSSRTVATPIRDPSRNATSRHGSRVSQGSPGMAKRGERDES